MRKLLVASLLGSSILMGAPLLAQTSNAPSPGVPGTGQKSANMSDFINKAANSNMFEIQSSQAALGKTQDSRLRQFAERMVQDHTQAGDKLKAAAQGQTVPTSLDQEHTRMLKQLQEAGPDEFDHRYAQMQFEGHQKTVALFEAYSQSGDNPPLKQFAEQTLPALREHLQQIAQIRTQLDSMARTTRPQPAQAQQAGTSAILTQQQPGELRASQLNGLPVYNNSNERVGDINEIVVNRDGKIEAVVIGVGGFLGLGERNVAVPFRQLQWPAQGGTAGTAPVASGDAQRAGTDRSAQGAETATAGANQDRDAPDRAILTTASRDQLRNAPEFSYRR